MPPIIKATERALNELDVHGYLERQADGHWQAEWQPDRIAYSNRTINRLIEQRKIKRIGNRVVKQESDE